MPNDFAGFIPRFKAFALDYLVTLPYLVLVVVLGLSLNWLVPDLINTVFGRQFTSELFGFFTVTLPVVLYFALAEASNWQGSWGKRKLKLRVLRLDNDKSLSTARSLLRSALKFVPWELSHAAIWYISFHPESPWPWFTLTIVIVYGLILTNVLLMIFSRKHQTLYDILAGTIVQR